METMGIISTGVVAAVVLVGAVVLVRSIPDIAHFRRIRNM